MNGVSQVKEPPGNAPYQEGQEISREHDGQSHAEPQIDAGREEICSQKVASVFDLISSLFRKTVFPHNDKPERMALAVLQRGRYSLNSL